MILHMVFKQLENKQKNLNANMVLLKVALANPDEDITVKGTSGRESKTISQNDLAIYNRTSNG